MSAKNRPSDGGPAYPQPLDERGQTPHPHAAWNQGMGGMSFRDRAAITAMLALIQDDISVNPDEIAQQAYRYADAMVAEAEGRGKGQDDDE